jgi:hypothetical protein
LRPILPQPICAILILLLGADLPKTDEGTMVGMNIAPAAVVIVCCKNLRRFILYFITYDKF